MQRLMSSLLFVVLCVLSTQAGETHWSLTPLSQPAIPAAGAHSIIDDFVAQKLHQNELTLSPPADRASWLRRVYFDLIGLPPSPREVEIFVNDDTPQAVERVVDRLLASPRYGERWARHWMDIVRYAETHGHDEDAIRENAWPYRDWLIRSLNADKPYAEFVREQVAGDVIAPEDPWAPAATGFLGCGPWDESSQMGIQDGTTDKKIAQYLDRDDMLSATMMTFTSTTAHCARCHDHKFDPVSLSDYYALQAVFAGVDKVDRPFEPDGLITRKRNDLLAQQTQLTDGTFPQSKLDEPGNRQAVDDWEQRVTSDRNHWSILLPTSVKSNSETPYTIQPDGSILFGGKPPATDTYTITGNTQQATITAVQLEVLTDSSFPANGPGRAENGNLHLSEVAVRIDGKPVTLRSATADFSQTAWGIDRAIDGNPDSAWGIHPEEGEPHHAVFVFSEPVKAAGSTTIEITLKQLHGREHTIGKPRISTTSEPAPEVSAPVPVELNNLLATPKEQRSQLERHAIALLWLKADTAQQIEALPVPGMVYAVASQFSAKGNFKAAGAPREVHVLKRGDIHSPIEPAMPGALSCIPKLPARFDLPDTKDEGARRAALANWLAHPDNVLTWRSIVNRVWHYHFGRGIVATPNDFGKMGKLPTHPELLDWLAIEFRNRGGSLKWLHKAIVLSATYGQAAADRADGHASDPENRLLWRMHRRRLDAENIRDAVLALSGTLDLRMGGPSARQFHTSPGVHVTPVVNYQEFDPDEPANFRRGVYRFVFRTVPDPLMQALDCPDASQLAARRETSTTALQALAMLNNRFLVRQTEHIAASLERKHKDLVAQVAELFLRAYSRPASENELATVTAYAHQHGLANACRVVINSSEFLFVR
ncbi:MAG: hypothetical protein ACI9R3_001961 [Verrucomicrobiales bacterium]|jgi:hypothetical protein